jgi:hypothetical protein
MNELIRHPEPVANDRQSFTIAEDDVWFYDSMWMGFNHRLVLTPKAHPWGGWEYGWCFRSALVLTAAMAVWEPEFQDEPVGWHKRPMPHKVRRAPRRDERPEVNRRRCEHGAVIETLSCVHVFCEAWPRR